MPPDLDGEFNQTLHQQWRQDKETLRLINFLQSRELFYLNKAADSVGQDGKTIRRLLTKAKAINEVLEYVTTGKSTGIRSE